MRQILFILTVGFFLFSQQESFAQRGEGHNKERWEKYKLEKIAFLTTNLDLTPTEAQKFWPVYNQMEKEKEEMQMKRRELEHQVRGAAETLSDKEVINLTRKYTSNQEKEGALNNKYNEEFLNILPPQKVLKLYKVEGEFRMHMFKKYREKSNKDQKRP